MSPPAEPVQPRSNATWVRVALAGAAVVAILAISEGPSGFTAMQRELAHARPHAPDLALLVHTPLLLRLHLATVVIGFGLGTVQLLGAKGTTLHRALGLTFVMVMLFTALDALMIKDGPTWRFTPIQLFSAIVLIGLPFSVLAARRHRVAEHARGMTAVYFGGLALAGILTMMPGRLMWRVFFG